MNSILCFLLCNTSQSLIIFISLISGNISIFRSLWFEIGESTWDNDQIAAMFKVVLDIRTSLNHVIGANNPKDIWVELVCTPAVFKELQVCLHLI